ncbi:hypothetical protein [Nocardia sp. NPDC127526]|uniref:hypothetical protein n=1 Tax=Nocardia sp. NPDC127526 TaxID=3345393 RepID=UPI00363D22D0
MNLLTADCRELEKSGMSGFDEILTKVDVGRLGAGRALDVVWRGSGLRRVRSIEQRRCTRIRLWWSIAPELEGRRA